MPLDTLVANNYGRALWDARPTTHSDKRARQLAAALGYPTGWRVVRSLASTETHPTIISDRIYAGDPSADADCWFHHAAAQQAAATWDENPHARQGGHLLARQARYHKGDKVQAFFEDEWWDAKIVRAKEHAVFGFRYQVHYAADNSKQSGVPEDWIRPRPDAPNSAKAKDPQELALQLGLGEGWLAESKGHNRYRVTDPNGKVYTSKVKALEAYEGGGDAAAARDEGDPPWRTTGHDLLGKRVQRQHVHPVSARRQVTIVQGGTISAWIAATDIDKAGNAGYVSEKTGEPAALFHVDFDEDKNHPYPSQLVESQDLEEDEVLEMMLDKPPPPPPADL